MASIDFLFQVCNETHDGVKIRIFPINHVFHISIIGPEPVNAVRSRNQFQCADAGFFVPGPFAGIKLFFELSNLNEKVILKHRFFENTLIRHAV